MERRRTYHLNSALDTEHAATLSKLAERVHVNEATRARALRFSASDATDP